MPKSVFVLYCVKDKYSAEKIIAQLQSAQFTVSHGTDLSYIKNSPEWEKTDIITPLLSFASLSDRVFSSQIPLIHDSKHQIIPIILEEKSIPLIAKQDETRKLLNVDYVDKEKEGDNAIRLYVRLTNKVTVVPKHHKIDNRLENYLRRLHARIGFINLSRIDANQEKVQLDDVFIPLYIEWTLGVEVKKYEIVNWWVNKPRNGNPSDLSEEKNRETQIPFGENADYIALQSLVRDVQQAIDLGIDSKYDDPGKRPLVLAPPWYDGIKDGFWPLQAIDIAATFKRLVILGAPGSGKSTFVRYLALCMLGSMVDPELPNANIRFLGKWPHGSLYPLFVELRQFVGWSGFPDLNSTVTEDHFWKYVKEEVLGNDNEVAHILRTELLDGHGIIILDGLDEVPIAEGRRALERRRQQLKDLARELSTIYAKSRIIFTSRDYAYRDWALDGFSSVKITPLNEDQMNNLATRLYTKKGFDHSEAQSKAAKLMLELLRVPAALKDYPLFLTLMATLFLKDEAEGLPTNKGDLYYKSIMLLLDRWTQPGLNEISLAEQIGSGVDKLYERLEVVAFKTHKESMVVSETPSNIPRALLLDELFEIGGQEDIAIAKLLSFVSEQAGVLISPEARVFQFAHRGFQEYLAASYLYRIIQDDSKKPGIEDDYKLVRGLIEQQPQVWREPCLLLSDVIVQRDRRDRLWDFIFALLTDDKSPKEISTESRRWWSIWLASKIMLDHTMYAGYQSKHKYLIDELRMWFKEILDRGNVLPAHERVETAMLLGKLGDDRPGVGLNNLIPDILWCSIPGSKYDIGSTPNQILEIQKESWAKGCTFTRETPSCSVELEKYQISAYPITQTQFQVFIDDKNGYFQERWWTKAGWQWVNKMGGPYLENKFAEPNAPRNYVSWYETIAYCRWLSDKLGCLISLPTEVCWEVAARGMDGRIFPWGNKFNEEFCNSSLLDFNSPNPVGCYKQAPVPWGTNGPFDMSGNIWEWCANIYEIIGRDKPFAYPYVKDDGRENIDYGDDCFRSVRGGSFLNPPFQLRTTFRGRDRPYNRAKRVGFRIMKRTN